MRKAKPEQIKAGNIRGFIAFIAQNFNINEDHLRMALQSQFPVLKDKKCCPNCERSMKINVYTAGIGHALLLQAMAREVKHELNKGVDFTTANKVHIDRLPIATSIKKQQSQAGYLGLIKPVVGDRRSGYWLITGWGWKALQGERIPKTVSYWNKKLVERSTETTTLSEMMKTHKDKIERQLRMGRAVKMNDYRSDIADYSPVEWAGYGGNQAGNLFP